VAAWEIGQVKACSTKACWPLCWVWVVKLAAWLPANTGEGTSVAEAPLPDTSVAQPVLAKVEPSKPSDTSTAPPVVVGVEVLVGVAVLVALAVRVGVDVDVAVAVGVAVPVPAPDPLSRT